MGTRGRRRTRDEPVRRARRGGKSSRGSAMRSPFVRSSANRRRRGAPCISWRQHLILSSCGRNLRPRLPPPPEPTVSPRPGSGDRAGDRDRPGVGGAPSRRIRRAWIRASRSCHHHRSGPLVVVPRCGRAAAPHRRVHDVPAGDDVRGRSAMMYVADPTTQKPRDWSRYSGPSFPRYISIQSGCTTGMTSMGLPGM